MMAEMRKTDTTSNTKWVLSERSFIQSLIWVTRDSPSLCLLSRIIIASVHFPLKMSHLDDKFNGHPSYDSEINVIHLLTVH